MIYDGTGSLEGGAGCYLVVLGQYRAVRVDIWCYLISMKRNWLIHDNTGRYWLVFGGDGAVLVGTWRYWVSITWCCLELSGTGLIWGFDACIYWKKGDLVACYHSGTNERRTRKDRATQPMDHGRLRWAIFSYTTFHWRHQVSTFCHLKKYKKFPECGGHWLGQKQQWVCAHSPLISSMAHFCRDTTSAMLHISDFRIWYSHTTIVILLFFTTRNTFVHRLFLLIMMSNQIFWRPNRYLSFAEPHFEKIEEEHQSFRTNLLGDWWLI